MKRLLCIVLTLLMVFGTVCTVSAKDIDTPKCLEGCRKYDLSAEMIETMAKVIAGEGGEIGLNASRVYASHMANVFEEKELESGITSAETLVSWYAGKSFKAKADDNGRQAVREVFLEGKRYLPRYIDEFDGFCELYDKSYSGKGAENFTIDGKTYYNQRKVALELVQNLEMHKHNVNGPHGGEGVYYMTILNGDGWNGNIFYYDPKSPINKYFAEDEAFFSGTQEEPVVQEPVVQAPVRTEARVIMEKDGQWIEIKGETGNPFNENDRVYLPLRTATEALGCQITYNDSTKTAYILTKNVSKPSGVIGYPMQLNFKIGSRDMDFMSVDEIKTVSMDVEPLLVEDRMYIPIRFLAEQLQYEVGWDDATKTVTLKQAWKISPPVSAY